MDKYFSTKFGRNEKGGGDFYWYETVIFVNKMIHSMDQTKVKCDRILLLIVLFCNQVIYIEIPLMCLLSFVFMNICSYVCSMEIKNIMNEELVEKLERIAFILKTVAHPMRLAIIHLLEQHPKLSVTEICGMLGTEQSITSHNLQNMKLKGILSSKRDGRSVYYSLKEKDVSMIIECLEDCKCNM